MKLYNVNEKDLLFTTMKLSLSLRKRDKILPPLRFRLSGNIDPLSSCSADNVPEKTREKTTTSSSLNLPKCAKYASTRRNRSSCNLEPLPDDSKANIIEQTFNEASKLTFNRRKRAKQVSSAKSVSPDNLELLPSGSTISAAKELFDDSTKPSFNFPKPSKHVSSQISESWCNLDPLLDGKKANASEKISSETNKLFSSKLHKHAKPVSFQQGGVFNFEKLPDSSKKTSAQTFDETSKSPALKSHKRVNSVSYKRSVSSENFEQLAGDIAKSSFNSSKSAKHLSSQRNKSSFDLEPSLDVMKEDISEQTFNKRKRMSLSKVCKRKKPVSSQRRVSSENNDKQSPAGSKDNITQQIFDVTTDASSKRKVSSSNLVPLSSDSKESVLEKTFDDIAKSTFNSSKSAKHMSSQRCESSLDFGPSLDVMKEDISEQTFNKKKNISLSKAYKHKKLLSSQKNVSLNNFEPLFHDSKKNTSQQAFGIITESSSFNPHMQVNFESKKIVSSDELEPLPDSLKEIVSEKTFRETTKTSSSNFHKRAKSVSSKIKVSSDNLDQLLGYSKDGVSEQAFVGSTESSFNDCKCAKHVSFQDSGISKSAVSEEIFGENFDLYTFKRCKCGDWLYKRSGSSDKFKPVLSDLKDLDSKQTFNDDATKLLNFHKRKSSQISGSLHNLDSLPHCSKVDASQKTLKKSMQSLFNHKCAKHMSSQNSTSSDNLATSSGFSKTAVSEQTQKNISDSSINPCKNSKNMSAQNSSSPGKFSSIPSPSKTPVSKQTQKNISDSSICPCKQPKHVSSQSGSSSGNLDSLPGFSKTPTSKQTFKKITDSSINPHKFPKHVSSQNSSSLSNFSSLPNPSKTPISEQTLNKITVSSICPLKHPEHVSSQSSSLSNHLDSIPDSSKTPTSKQTLKNNTDLSISPHKNPKHASSQNSSSSSNLDSIPKTPISKKTFKKITDSSISPCKHPKHVSSQNSSSSSNLDSIPGSSKTPVTKQTFKKIVDSSISPRKKTKHVSPQSSGLSSNLDSIPGSSKNAVSMPTFDGASKDNSSKGNKSNQLADVSLNIIKSKFRRFIRGEKKQQNICHIVASRSDYVLKEILKAATDYMKECGRSQFTAADFHRGISVCGLDLEDSDTEKKKKPVRKRKKPMPEGNTEKGPSEDKKPKGNTEKEPSEDKKPEGNTKKEPSEDKKPEWNTKLELSEDKKSEGNTEKKPSEHKKPEGNTELEPSEDKKLHPVKSSSQNVYVNERWLRDPLSVNIEDLEEELQNYFKAMVVILYYNMEEEGCVLSNNMQTNRNLTQLIPHFVDFFCKVIAEFENDFVKVSLVFKFIDSLLRNPYVYFGQDCYLNTLFCAFFKFLVADLQQSNQGSLDCWTLKDNVGNIVLLILKKSKCQHLYFEGMSLVNSVLTSDYSLNSCYGALVFLKALGVPAILQLLPSYIEKFYAENQTVSCSNSDVLLVQGKIIRLYYILVNYYLKNEVKELEFNLFRHVRSKFLFPDYLRNIKVFPILSNIEKTFSSCAGEVLLPVKVRLLNFVFHSTNLEKRKITRQAVSRKKKQRNKKICFTNYPLLMGTII